MSSETAMEIEVKKEESDLKRVVDDEVVPAKRIKEDEEEPSVKTEEVEEKKESGPFSKAVLEQVLDHCVNEKDVGITHFMSENKPCRGIFRHRFSDFIVHEIQKDGTIVKLTETSAQRKASKTDSILERIKKIVPTEEAFSELTSLIDEESVAKLRTLTAEDPIKLPFIEDKDKRTKIHQIIRESFSDVTTSVFKNEDEKHCIQIQKCEPKDKVRDFQRFQAFKGKSQETTLQFTLYKEQIDTMQVISLLARHCKLGQGKFSYAGNKDKRSISSQKVTCTDKSLKPDKLYSGAAKVRGLEISDIVEATKPLQLGDLRGNHFTIVLREFEGDQASCAESLERIKSTGLINYFGMQRFGSTAVPTHAIGRALLQGNYKDACDLILVPRPFEQREVTQARKQYERFPDKFQKALDMFPRRYMAECTLMGAFNAGKSPEAAIQQIPRNLRLMYTHAYQSYIWNFMATVRMQKFGSKVIAGDLIILDDDNEQDSSKVHPKDKKGVKVHIVSEQEANDNAFTIDLISLPIPGYAVIYPENSIGEDYESKLKEDNFTSDTFKNQRSDAALPGGYRKLIEMVPDMTWEFVKYSNENEQLTQSDVEELNGVPLPMGQEDGKFTALRMSFSLSSSSYATMVIREVMKMDSSMHFHRDISQAKQEKEKIDAVEF